MPVINQNAFIGVHYPFSLGADPLASLPRFEPAPPPFAACRYVRLSLPFFARDFVGQVGNLRRIVNPPAGSEHKAGVLPLSVDRRRKIFRSYFFSKLFQAPLAFFLFAALLSAQTNPVADGIAAFNRGDYKTARL